MLEYDDSGGIVHRYVRADGIDRPVAAYLYAGTANRRFYHADERGSIAAMSDGSGNIYQANRFDEYGIPGPTNSGRFQYTGQAWLAEVGLHHYRARMYNPRLGRFLQTDPIGYGAGMNLYAYVRNDPINLTDPIGLQDRSMGPNPHVEPVIPPGDEYVPDGQTVLVTGTLGPNFEICHGCLGDVDLSMLDVLAAVSSGNSTAYASDHGTGGGQSRPTPPERPQPPPRPPRPPDRPTDVCRTVSVLAFSILFGVGVIGEVGHGLAAARAGIVGAQVGARAGPLGAGAGAVLAVGLLVGAGISGEEILTSICGPR